MPWIPLAAAAITAGGSYLAAKQAGKGTKPTATQSAIEGQTLDNMKAASPFGMDFLKSGQANLKLFNDFYKKLATGDRASAMALLAPQFRMMDEQASAGLGSEIALGRSGGSGESRIASMDARKGAREDSILGLRTSAIDKLGAVGGEQVSLGSGLLGQSNSSGLGLWGAIQGQRNSAFDQSRAAGASMFEILKMLGDAGSTWWNNRQTGQANTNAMMQFAPGGRYSTGSIW